MWRRAVNLSAGLLFLACSSEPEQLHSLRDLNNTVRDYAQGCDWREDGPEAFEPRDPAACYRVFAWVGSRLSDFQLAEPCDAPELPPAVVYRPGAQLWGYYDRSETGGAKVLRVERLDACP